MKFEAILNGKTMMSTDYIECIPNENHIISMAKAGYKFKIDDKAITQKKIKEFIEAYELQKEKVEI